MEPAIGSVFAVWVDRWGRYALRQLCGEADGQRWWLDLDWFEPELPTDLTVLRPLRQHRYFIDDEISYKQIPGPIPADWILIGEREPLQSDPPTTYALVPEEPAAAWEYAWLQFPKAQRDAFHEAVRSRGTVQVAGRELGRSAVHLTASMMRAPAAELAQLACVLTVEIAEDRPDLAEVLAGFTFLREVTVSGPLTDLTLPPQVGKLSLEPGASADMVVAGGSVTRLHAGADTLVELPDVAELFVSRITDLDVSDLAARYPDVLMLSLIGSPGTLTGLDGLSQLPNLRQLFLTDLFGFDTIPHLPAVEHLWLESIPKKAGAQARKDYAGIDLDVTKLRDDAWLADNLNNPFRSWDGSEFVPPRYAKSAWTAYKKHRKTLRAAAAQAAAGELSAEAFAEVVIDTITTMAQEFNRWDKSGWIETVEREHIAETYYVLLNEVSKTYPVDIDAAMTALDNTRDW